MNKEINFPFELVSPTQSYVVWNYTRGSETLVIKSRSAFVRDIHELSILESETLGVFNNENPLDFVQKYLDKGWKVNPLMYVNFDYKINPSSGAAYLFDPVEHSFGDWRNGSLVGDRMIVGEKIVGYISTIKGVALHSTISDDIQHHVNQLGVQGKVAHITRTQTFPQTYKVIMEQPTDRDLVKNLVLVQLSGRLAEDIHVQNIGEVVNQSPYYPCIYDR